MYLPIYLLALGTNRSGLSLRINDCCYCPEICKRSRACWHICEYAIFLLLQDTEDILYYIIFSASGFYRFASSPARHRVGDPISTARYDRVLMHYKDRYSCCCCCTDTYMCSLHIIIWYYEQEESHMGVILLLLLMLSSSRQPPAYIRYNMYTYLKGIYTSCIYLQQYSYVPGTYKIPVIPPR